MTKILCHVKSNVIAYLALFVALGGTGYAAASLPKGSVGNRQIKNHAVTPIKFDKGSIAGYVKAWAKISGNGTIAASRPSAHLISWQTTAPFPGGLIGWSESIPASCFAIATTSSVIGASYASADLASVDPKHDADTYVRLSAPSTPVNVAIICPQP